MLNWTFCASYTEIEIILRGIFSEFCQKQPVEIASWFVIHIPTLHLWSFYNLRGAKISNRKTMIDQRSYVIIEKDLIKWRKKTDEKSWHMRKK